MVAKVTGIISLYKRGAVRRTRAGSSDVIEKLHQLAAGEQTSAPPHQGFC